VPVDTLAMAQSAKVTKRSNDPHSGQPVRSRGVELHEANLVMLLLHGRGASAESILALYDELSIPNSAAWAPQASGSTWYPQSFLAPLAANQPDLDSALNRVNTLIEELIEKGIRASKLAIIGFSQGACLTLEYAARNPLRYGAIIGLTGGLIGPPGTERSYRGSLDGTPVFLGSSDPDPHVPFQRVIETRDVLVGLGATVELRRYAGMGHIVNADELSACQNILSAI
jgi:predicted esterase